MEGEDCYSIKYNHKLDFKEQKHKIVILNKLNEAFKSIEREGILRSIVAYQIENYESIKEKYSFKSFTRDEFSSFHKGFQKEFINY